MPLNIPLKDRHLVVWGLGRTGTSMAHYLARQGARVSVIERAAASQHEATQALLTPFGVEFYWGGTLPEPAVMESVDAIVLSPGVPYDLPPLQQARAQGIETVAAIQWSARQISIPTVAVTGTAGKSTTVCMIGEMLQASGYRTFVGGNLGIPLVESFDWDPMPERIVLECSSFQLEAAPALRPKVAVLTNFSSNHLDRHGTMEHYAACKAKLFESLPADAWAISRAADPTSQPILQTCVAQQLFVYPKETSSPGAMPTDGGFVLRLPHLNAEEHYTFQGFRLRGQHNRENAMTAALAARLLDATPQGIQAALQTFRGLPHRLEWLAEIDGVQYINDSKSTTPRSTYHALSAFDPSAEPVHVLLGGRSKGSRFDELAPVLAQRTKAIYLFGESAREIANDLAQSNLAYSIDARMEDALLRAKQQAHAGDLIVLSPACASFDQFANFEARGDAFRSWVQQWISPSSSQSDHA